MGEKMIEDMGSEYKVNPLSGRGTEIIYEKENKELNVKWGTIDFKVKYEYIDDIMNKFFTDSNEWYSLGASMDKPIKGGLGEYVKENIPSLTSRHASAIAAILYNENLIYVKGKKPLYLKKVV